MTDRTEVRPTDSLKPHPANAEIYQQEYPLDDLIVSIEAEGLQEPIAVLDDGTIISGHRRWRALQALGIDEVKVRVVNPDDPIVILIEMNRYRDKSEVERYNEAKRLEDRIRHRAHERKVEGAKRGGCHRHRKGSKKPEDGEGPRRSLDDLAEIAGMSPESFRKLDRVMTAACDDMTEDSDERIAEIQKQLADQKISVNRAYQRVTALQASRPEGTAAEPDPDLKPFDVWEFPSRNEGYGGRRSPFLGKAPPSPPPQVWKNLIHNFTEPGDDIIDVTAGGGSVADVAQAMGRGCESFDLNPCWEGCEAHDITSGVPPVDDRRFSLGVIDPPYFRQVQYSDKAQDLSNRETLDDFLEALSVAVQNTSHCLAPGGRLAVIVGNQCTKAEGLIDLAWHVGKMLDSCYGIERRIWVPYSPAHFTGPRVTNAKESKRLLARTRELFIVVPQNQITPESGVYAE